MSSVQMSSLYSYESRIVRLDYKQHKQMNFHLNKKLVVHYNPISNLCSQEIELHICSLYSNDLPQ
ncbi:hypothetical protein BK5-Tp34 [Lactococcus phage BK5-T]|uniref:Uncharacterized protein n=1 Tax=Lactococcus phage BK5-T TaxID=31754 RepID=Q94M94_9CAUD|nr:hypothetical protein BK5-Tp34 [Lactococcus phage BK5-T]YP_010133254.1 hypothetical protein K3164_gp34 [Lactococcus phage BK5-T]AAK56825.1 unknown [Lactococcus phage BK5-T]CAC80175.1 hypothetical protein [Lactococcus phage BK5-T]